MADLGPARSIPHAAEDVAIDCAASQAKVVFRGRPAAIDAIARALDMNLGGIRGRYAEQGDQRALWLGPDEWLLKSAITSDALLRTLEEASAGLPHALVDVSSTYRTLRVSGEYSAFLINHGCPLDLSLKAFGIRNCTRTLLGKTGIILSRVEERTFEIDVVRSFATYAMQFLQEAGIGLRGSSLGASQRTMI